jgi:hypothetical protein
MRGETVSKHMVLLTPFVGNERLKGLTEQRSVSAKPGLHQTQQEISPRHRYPTSSLESDYKPG